MTRVHFENRSGIGLLTLDSPETLNSLSSDFLGEIRQAVESLPALDVLIITGVGKSFVAGANIKEMEALNPGEAKEFSRRGHEVFTAIENLPCPVIAMVNGFALGGGCELMLACDLRVASSRAKFGQPEVGLGIIPGFGGTQRLTLAVGPAKAKELIYTGRIIKAEEALTLGLISQIAEPEELEAAALTLAQEIQKNSAAAVGQAKRAMAQGLAEGFEAGLAAEVERFAECFEHGDQKEGMTAFLEKRKPAFGGK
ncbi:Crotonyl-CoA hydratase [anaerobic digester metagenome]